MRQDGDREAKQTQVRPAADGLAPAMARDWLELHRVLAWQPEEVGSRLRAGATPKEVLCEFGGQLELLSSRSRRSGPGSHGAGYDDSSRESGAMQVTRFEALGLRVVPLTHESYPQPLAEIVDAPPVLLVRGMVSALSTPAIAIIGARAATRSARDTARGLARDLAVAGLTIVSGLARGIDAEAHRGALEAKGRTVGVLACGPDQIYPPEHRGLAAEMAERGAVISEMPLGVPPRPAHFPLRNRIISGLCMGIIVVEARRRSGSLITVRHALGQGREVFVVPGSTDGPFAEGTNQLLRDGARPICCARDVIEDLGFRASLAEGAGGFGASPGKGSTASALEARILLILEDGPITRDELRIRAGLEEGAELASPLLELELSGRIILERDGRIHAKWG